jgi:hypothetical protein
MRTLALPFLIVLIAAIAGCTEDPIYYPWGDGGNVTPLDADGDDTSGPDDEDASLADTNGGTDDTSVPDSGSDTTPPTDTTRPPEDTSVPDTNVADTTVRDTGGGADCFSSFDCDGGVCVSGRCAECAASGDCPEGEVCMANECVTSDAGVPDVPVEPTDCDTDAECVAAAILLGHSGEGAACDPEVGCFILGECNSSGGFPGTVGTDPFEAPCSSDTVCSTSFDLSGGGAFTFACAGCTVGDDGTCRAGEICYEDPLDLLGSGPKCLGEERSEGSGGFPFPFP